MTTIVKDFNDIGNRKVAAAGGNEWGSNLRYENYTANSLNESINHEES